MKKITILEPGAWGITLGILLSRNHEVLFWYSDKDLAEEIGKNRENERLSGTKIPRKISVSSDLGKSLDRSDLIIIAASSFNFRDTVERLKKFGNLPPLLGIAKGIEKGTCLLPSQIVKDVLGERVSYCHLSGPGFAKEIILGRKAQEVIASENPEILGDLKELFTVSPLEIFTTQDVIGLQLAGAFKNVISIGIGLIEAKNPVPAPEKTKKTLITLGLEEMIKLGRKLGAEEKTFRGPAGLGDLILTASPLSRNWQFGREIFKYCPAILQAAKEKKSTTEGFNSVSGVLQLAKKYSIDLPIISEIHKVIYGEISPTEAIENLVTLTK